MNVTGNDWTQQRLFQMIENGAEENINLDFKSGDTLSAQITDKIKQDICKDVSAFANSDGGVLIYGITEIDHKANSFSFVDGNIFTKERLEQVINDGIQRRIDGIVITPVRIDGDIKKTVYVVEIPVSPLAPHMVKDKRYFKRFNFMSVHMEEYEVRQTFERRQNSKLVIGDIVYEFTNIETWFNDQAFKFDFHIHIENIGHAVAINYKIMLNFKEGPLGTKFTFEKDKKYVLTKLSDNTTTISTSSSIPIYPDEHVNGMQIGVIVPWEYQKDINTLEIGVSLFQAGGKEKIIINPGDGLHNLIMKNINPEYIRQKEEERLKKDQQKL